MIRVMNLNTAFLALTLVIAYGTYHVKYDAQRNLDLAKSLDRQIGQERARKKVLEADWSVLNEPGRLQRLAVRYLALTKVEAKQISTVAEIRARVPVLTASAPDRSNLAAAAHEAKYAPDGRVIVLRR